MKQIEKLLKEYKIRFNVTDRILEKNYLFFDLEYINNGSFGSSIDEDMIFNKNGVILKNGIWATADIKELPEKWVVEKDETSPLWERFKDKWNTEDIYDYTKALNENKFFSEHTSSQDLLIFTNHQYLTLEQWAEFCLPKVDFSILNDDDWFYCVDKVNKKYVFKNKTQYCLSDERLLFGDYIQKNKDYVTELRKATEDDLKLLFEKHPELASPQVNDLGLYFDNPKDKILDLKNGIVLMGKITDINNSTNGAYRIDGSFYWKFFYKIDMYEPLQPQIDKFIEIYKNK